MTEIRLARSDAEVRACYPVMSQLRPHLVSDEFLDRIRGQEAEGYHLTFIEMDGRPVAVAGYRFLHQLAVGKVLYVDDLVTDETLRSSGLGTRMLRWLLEEARSEGCQNLELDSATHRKDTHRFYERAGMGLASFHYKRPVE